MALYCINWGSSQYVYFFFMKLYLYYIYNYKYIKNRLTYEQILRY